MPGRIGTLEALAIAGLFSLTSALFAQTLPRTPDSAEAKPEAAAPAVPWWEQDIWKDPERGFHYYPEPRRPREKPENKPKEPISRKSLKDIADLDELKAERERRLKAAVMNPSTENMVAYLEANTLVLQKSAMFADVWRRTVWTHPEFSFNAQNPTANFAQAELRQARMMAREDTARDLAGDHGLLFFYRSDCPYCKLQAPVLRRLSERYGIEVLAISLDGGPLDGWPEAKPDNGISNVVSLGRGIEAVPALYLVSRDRRQAVLLGAGVLALDDIVERMHVLAKVGVGEGLAGGVR